MRFPPRVSKCLEPVTVPAPPRNCRDMPEGDLAEADECFSDVLICFSQVIKQSSYQVMIELFLG